MTPKPDQWFTPLRVTRWKRSRGASIPERPVDQGFAGSLAARTAAIVERSRARISFGAGSRSPDRVSAVVVVVPPSSRPSCPETQARCARGKVDSVDGRRERDDISMEQRDFFISYASPDRESYAVPLERALQAEYMTCWFDKGEIRAGDSVSGKIVAVFDEEGRRVPITLGKENAA